MGESHVYSTEVYEATLRMLKERGVTLEDIADVVLFLQKDYVPELSLETCIDSIHAVLAKREVQNAILTGIQLDMLAEQKKLFSPLQEMLEVDESLFGVDEVLALAIINIYGSIGFTNFGYIDKIKCGILGFLNDKKNGVHTFLDDLVGAVAAAASSRIAHRYRHRQEQEWKAAKAPQSN